MTIRPEYKIYASWGPRPEPPEAIAARYLACTGRLKQIHPAYDNWIFNLNGKPKKFDALREKLAEAIAANVARADDGDPTPIYGYWPTVTNTMRKSHSRSLSLHVKAGSWVNNGYFCNSAWIRTGNRVVPDPTIIAYPAFKAALLALVESFDVAYCSAYPQQITDFWDPAPHLRIGWMSYVPARFASLITPPPSAVAERTAQGGLLMSATAETFRVDNPAHLAAARDILQALAPFEALPGHPTPRRIEKRVTRSRPSRTAARGRCGGLALAGSIKRGLVRLLAQNSYPRLADATGAAAVDWASGKLNADNFR